MDDIIHASFKELDRVLKHSLVAERDDRCTAALADSARQGGASITISKKKSVNGRQLIVARRFQPLKELRWRKSNRRNAFTIETADVAGGNVLPIINDHVHAVFAPFA